MIHLVLGGARSGKSSFAERRTCEYAGNSSPYYLATAQAYDNEMQARIAKHQKDRAQHYWLLIECPLDIEQALLELPNHSTVLIDCLTLWINNVLMSLDSLDANYENKSQQITARIADLLHVLSEHSKRLTIVVVANEVGLGVVPLGEQTRLFVDHAGWLNQKLAKVAEQVTLVTAGLPLTLKGSEHG
ncbi:bifunctional adenosylcobinamide kinase/adenosylcobinamide-phosphate guanylyltransferase [Thalassotalea sediminis]|uniref:bifunctional adenosylcobinamide kinase/adenosylcobinamide-phosphate guanylyltransferase n=1 Tax=Thalassotalea sediminis TaxID=1759089 RepID=UPI002572F2BB|nr:bifunctional adenosylcobinamide kinase/adenosylcobinamide-phosphate guanylyltransferase [Thalassotalea sediminis]